MASEDVIELGSSDDDVEPAPKRPKTKLNAMVHIPNNLTGITIKPAKACNSAVPPSLLGRPITITKVSKNSLINPVLTKLKKNGCAVQRHTSATKLSPKQIIKQPQKIKSIGTIQTAQSVNILNHSIRTNNVQQLNRIPVRAPINVQKVKSLIPSSITVKKTQMRKQAHPVHTNMTNVKRKERFKISCAKLSRAEVSTVELDDDDNTCVDPGPARQWYLRPEDTTQTEKNDTEEPSDMEKQNNAEPNPSEMVEITIQDSPIQSKKKAFEVGAEFAITIDDSPSKPPAESKSRTDSSDSENNKQKKESHRKKKLEYPKEQKKRQSIEIEILPINANQNDNADERNTLNNDTKEQAPQNTDVIEIEESPMKIPETEATTPKKKTSNATVLKNKPFNIQKEEVKQNGEFHPVYQEFIDLCFKLESTEDMEKIIEKKIKSYYRQVPKDYTESEEFVDMVSGKIISMKASPEKMYLYIKDIVDELNFKRKMLKSQGAATEETKSNEIDSFLYGENSELGPKRQRQIRKLEKTLKKLHRAIQKLEEQEVDFDDDDDSVYLLTERYKERMVRVHAKFCQLTNTKMPSEPRLQIEPRPGQPKGPARRLEKWINKKVPIGTPLPFPDFHDVLRCVREANEEDKLGWNEVDVMEEARDLFTRCGKKLQRRRQENEWRLASSRLPVDVDPAENSSELKVKLQQNKAVANQKETEVFNKYADKQNQLKLEAEEIGDKEAEESPEESDEEETQTVETPMKNKEKRKERLKRLLQGKSRRSINTDHKPDNETEEKKDTISNDNDTENSEKLKEVGDSENKEDSDKNANTSNQSVHQLTDIDSDVDELHLLQKLHSDEFNSSSSDTSNSVIEFSDTQESSNDNKNSDVISIEDSSYSESETQKGAVLTDEAIKEKSMCELETIAENSNEEIEFSSAGVEATGNNQFNKVHDSEEVLLASSDDENYSSKDESPETCINLNDDSISIGETVVAGVDNVEETAVNGVNAENEETGVKINENAESMDSITEVCTGSYDSVTISCDQLPSSVDVDSNVIEINKNENDKLKNKDNIVLPTESENPVGSSTDENEVVTTSLPDAID